MAIVGGSSVVSGKKERPVRGVPAADGCGVGGDPIDMPGVTGTCDGVGGIAGEPDGCGVAGR
ncbi:MAG: hypothetical protein ACLQBL_01920 [Polyangiaceae bacterium]